MSKETTNDVRRFSTFFLNKHHDLQIGNSYFNRNIIWSINGNETGRINYELIIEAENPRIILDYKVRSYGAEEWNPMRYNVPLEAVKCHFGGLRWYFRCMLSKDGVYCGKRVAILYSVGNYFGCRKCANLTYSSCNESKSFRGYPWKVLTDDWKADEIYSNLRQTHYKGKPTRNYRKCLELWGV